MVGRKWKIKYTNFSLPIQLFIKIKFVYTKETKKKYTFLSRKVKFNLGSPINRAMKNYNSIFNMANIDIFRDSSTLFKKKIKKYLLMSM